MAAQEWVNENSPEYEKILRFIDKDHTAMMTRAGEKIDCEVDAAYAYVKKDDEVVIGLIPRVQFAVNMADKPDIAGEYVINDIIGEDMSSDPKRYLIEHRQFVSLDFLNHIIDINRPDILDPQTIYNNPRGFKEMAQVWTDHHWLSPVLNQKVQGLPANRSDLVDVAVVNAVRNHAGFKRTLQEWRRKNWISESKAKQYAITGMPLKTLDDELGFAATFSR